MLHMADIRIDPWRNLDLQEAVEVREWLFSDEQGLNLTSTEDAFDR
jgi:hypothetical protein